LTIQRGPNEEVLPRSDHESAAGEGEMRHPIFIGLRVDKKALDVIRQQA